jgi:hypothetical protein
MGMTESKHTLEFWPQYSQFVLYDVKEPFDPDEVPLWNAPDETKQRLSVRRLEVSVGLLDDAEVRIEMSTHAKTPMPIEGAWEVNAEATFEVPNGVLGVRDVVSDHPELTLEIPPGKLNLRVYGRMIDQDQFFAVQLWPA